MSTVDIVLVPPEKLSIEVDSSGGYFRHAWYKNDEEMYPNGDTTFLQQNPERFSEFFQVYVQDHTTTSDHGVYRVELIDNTTQVLHSQVFTVTPFSEYILLALECVIRSSTLSIAVFPKGLLV